jgi:hypothetical protein
VCLQLQDMPCYFWRSYGGCAGGWIVRDKCVSVAGGCALDDSCEVVTTMCVAAAKGDHMHMVQRTSVAHSLQI